MNNFLSKISLKKMLLILSSFSVGIVAAVGVYLLFTARDFSNLVAVMYDGPVMSSTFSQSSKVNFLRYNASVRKLLLCGTEDKCDGNSTEYSNHLTKMTEDLSVVIERSLSKENASIVKEIQEKVVEIEKVRKDLYKEVQSGKHLGNQIANKWDQNELRKTVESKLEKLTDNEAENGYNKRQEVEHDSEVRLRLATFVLISGVLLSLVIISFAAAGIASPIKRLSRACLSFADGNSQARVRVGGSPEIIFLGNAFNQMAERVQQREGELREEHKKITNLLNNMKQALFTVGPSGKIYGPISKYSDSVFGLSIIDLSVFDVLYGDLKADSEEFSLLKSTMVAVFGSDDIQWELSEKDFIGRVIRKTNGEQILKVTYIPLWDDKGILEKIMYVVEDITQLEALETRINLETAKSGRKTQIIQELLALKRQEIPNFIQRMNEVLGDLSQVSEDYGTRAVEMSRILRGLHTVKGNTRMLGFGSISQICHTVESQIALIREGVLTDAQLWLNFVKNQWPVLLNSIQSQFHDYEQAVKELFGNSLLDSVDSPRSFKEGIRFLRDKIDLNKEIFDSNSYQFLRNELDSLESISFKEILSVASKMVEEIALETHKKVAFELKGDVLLKQRDASLLNDIMVHLLRNSMDHGIETTEERVKAGKPETGKLEVVMENGAVDYSITIRDDGRGIDPDGIVSSAVKKGFLKKEDGERLCREEKIDLIFLPGFSSRSEVGEFSGRGVGMDVVKENLRTLKGEIKIDTQIGKGVVMRLLFKNKIG